MTVEVREDSLFGSRWRKTAPGSTLDERFLSPRVSQRRHRNEVGDGGRGQGRDGDEGTTIASGRHGRIADDRQVQSGTGGEPGPSRSAPEEARDEGEIGQSHHRRGPRIGQTHERSDTGRCRRESAADDGRDHTDPDRCSLRVVRRHPRQRPVRTVRSKMPSVARRAESGTIGNRSLMSPSTLDQS